MDIFLLDRWLDDGFMGKSFRFYESESAAVVVANVSVR
jgi:hypothetical protein